MVTTSSRGTTVTGPYVNVSAACICILEGHRPHFSHYFTSEGYSEPFKTQFSKISEVLSWPLPFAFGSCRHLPHHRELGTSVPLVSFKYGLGQISSPFCYYLCWWDMARWRPSKSTQSSQFWYEFLGTRGSSSWKDASELYTADRDSSLFNLLLQFN